ncbi:MAG: hypothetical protein AB1714_18000 [Acidobacteriota bacterium]
MIVRISGLICIPLAVLLATAPGRGESLAEAAKAQKEYEKKLQASGTKVRTVRLTGQALPEDVGAVSKMGKPAEASRPMPAAVTGEIAKQKALENTVGTRVDFMRAEVDRLQKEVDELATVDGRHYEYGWKKSRLDRLKSELSVLEEEARKRGLPPGVVR